MSWTFIFREARQWYFMDSDKKNLYKSLTTAFLNTQNPSVVLQVNKTKFVSFIYVSTGWSKQNCWIYWAPPWQSQGFCAHTRDWFRPCLNEIVDEKKMQTILHSVIAIFLFSFVFCAAFPQFSLIRQGVVVSNFNNYVYHFFLLLPLL
jgi:hypothetical protein